MHAKTFVIVALILFLSDGTPIVELRTFEPHTLMACIFYSESKPSHSSINEFVKGQYNI
jgi:hypothetical protein